MAMTRCKECARDVSKRAETCPGCGGPGPAGRPVVARQGGRLIAAGVLLTVWPMVALSTATQTQTRPSPVPGLVFFIGLLLLGLGLAARIRMW